MSAAQPKPGMTPMENCLMIGRWRCRRYTAVRVPLLTSWITPC